MYKKNPSLEVGFHLLKVASLTEELKEEIRQAELNLDYHFLGHEKFCTLKDMIRRLLIDVDGIKIHTKLNDIMSKVTAESKKTKKRSRK